MFFRGAPTTVIDRRYSTRDFFRNAPTANYLRRLGEGGVCGWEKAPGLLAEDHFLFYRQMGFFFVLIQDDQNAGGQGALAIHESFATWVVRRETHLLTGKG